MRYVFDLDGTLCQTQATDYANAVPLYGRIRRVNTLFDEGHTIEIWTARGSGSGADLGPITEQQLRLWGVKYHKLSVDQKPPADRFVDDRAISANEFFQDSRTTS